MNCTAILSGTGIQCKNYNSPTRTQATHLFRAPLLIRGGGLLSTGATLSSLYLLVKLDLLLHLFPAYI